MPEGTTTPGFGDARLPQRFWDKVRVDPDGCWRWTAAKRGRGYGAFSLNGRITSTHVLSYRTLVESISAGLVVDHMCHDPRSCGGGDSCPHRCCVNPAHMEIKRKGENTSRGRVSHWSSRKTECPNGHPYTPENTRLYRGNRYCLACQEIRLRQAAALTKPATPATHCRRGHEYTPENTRQYPNGRICKTCEVERKRQAREEYRAANPVVPVTHCIHGHEFTPENTRYKANGTRRCNACARERMREVRKRKREQV